MSIRELLPTRGDLATMRVQPRRDLLAGLTVAVVVANTTRTTR